MPREKVLIVGLGEVGLPLYKLLAESELFEVYGFDIDQEKMEKLHQNSIPRDIRVMHICIQCFHQKEFVDIVSDYARRFKPELIIIDSTVPPQTTIHVHSRCHCLVAHSPIRGVHQGPEHMMWEIRRWTKYIGGATQEAAEAAREHLKKLGLKTKTLRSSTETELAKLFETTYRAWMISCFQEMHRIAAHFDAKFDDVVDFLEDTHRVRLDRPVMFPGEIGGHCLIPNVNLLQDNCVSEFFKLILKSNEKRKQDMKNPKTREEAEEIRKRAENLQKDLMSKWSGK